MKASQYIIGPSNGWLFDLDVYDINQHIQISRDAGANAMEFVMRKFIYDDKRFVAMKNFQSENNADFAALKFKSLHLPTYDVEANFHDVVNIGGKIFDKLGIDACVTHPVKNKRGEYPKDFLFNLSHMSFNLSIENMDKQTNGGYEMKEIALLMDECDCNLVLDLQHAYEHDPTMGYACRLLIRFREQITYYHVSGQTATNNHALLHKADNAEKILQFLQISLRTQNKPIILEGQYCNVEELTNEIKFITNYLEKNTIQE